jgi:hypothetical protein
MITKEYLMSNIIPRGATTKKREVIEPDLYEWRWRFFTINKKKYVEISYFKDGTRKYYTHDGNYLYNITISQEFNKYLTNELYYYAKL